MLMRLNSNIFQKKKIISKYQCGFRNGYSVKYCLIAMIEKWEKNVDDVGVFGALLSDLS